jgi:hypothetical protein
MIHSHTTETHSTKSDLSPTCCESDFIQLLERKTGLSLDNYLGLREDIDQSDLDTYKQRCEFLINHFPKQLKQLLEVGESKGFSANFFASHGHRVVTLNTGEEQPLASDSTRNYSYQQNSFTNFSKTTEQTFDVCLFQERLPSKDTLDTFNRTWQILNPDGRVLLLQEFRIRRTALDEVAFLPVKRHLIRQVEDCGFKLEAEVDLTKLATNSIRHHLNTLKSDQHHSDKYEINFSEKLNTYSNALKEYDKELRCYLLLQFRKHTKPRWRIGLARKEDSEGLGELFQESFNDSISQDLWSWKYASQPVMNVIAIRNDQVVAHYGGIKRKIHFQNKIIDGVQISDVMVSPKERGILTRKGAFFRVAAAFPEYFVGYAASTLIGYGFPNMRHMRIAETMKLYSEVGRIEELSWDPSQALPDKLTGCREIDFENDQQQIDDLWTKMAADLSDALICVRNASYLQKRYLQHPHNKYQLLFIYRRVFGAPLGIAVVHQINAESCRLIDLISPLKNLTKVINKTKLHAKNLGCKELVGWGSEQTVKHLNQTHPERRQTDICIPTSIWTDGPSPETLKGKWWLMYGDTDFN